MSRSLLHGTVHYEARTLDSFLIMGPWIEDAVTSSLVVVVVVVVASQQRPRMLCWRNACDALKIPCTAVPTTVVSRSR